MVEAGSLHPTKRQRMCLVPERERVVPPTADDLEG